ncbi:hypothetical protein PIB30_032616 [Stylosanthes scabra]|uniref:Anamorsin homolog n=1 Tax=Stylosanthes scabra TaxID=79078 RepID=A0ABU6UB10_9FABA|nr:hypothetical protein [Stylosanthes scabra]
MWSTYASSPIKTPLLVSETKKIEKILLRSKSKGSLLCETNTALEPSKSSPSCFLLVQDHIAMDATKTSGAVLACTDEAVLPVSQVFEAIKELGNEGAAQYDPLVVTSASSLSKLPVESSSVDTVVLIWQSLDFPMDQLFQEVLRVLKLGGTALILKSAVGSPDKVISDLESKLLFAGFTEAQVVQLKSTVLSGSISSGIKAKKPSWKVGSSFALKKVVKNSPKVQLDVDSDLIDEDSLLTEEDLKKPQLPPSNDYFYNWCP